MTEMSTEAKCSMALTLPLLSCTRIIHAGVRQIPCITKHHVATHLLSLCCLFRNDKLVCRYLNMHSVYFIVVMFYTQQ